MWNKILKVLTLFSILQSSAFADEGQFTLVPKGGTVPFEATCFDDQATAKLITWKEFLEEQLSSKCQFEKAKIILDFELRLSNLQIELDESKFRLQTEISARDEEIKQLRDIIKKNRKVNIPVIVVSSLVAGIGIGFGAYHLASR